MCLPSHLMTRSSPSPSTVSPPPTTTIFGHHCSTAPNHRCTPMTTTTTWHINGCATSSWWWWWSLSTLLKVSNLNSQFSSLHTRHSSHVAVGIVSTNNGWLMSNHGRPGEPSTTLLSPFLTTEGGPCHQRQCGKQQASFNCPQPLPNNNNNVAIPHHTTPNDAANNKDEQPTTTATHDHPLTKTNQHQSNQPQASIRMTTSTHERTQITMSRGKASSPPHHPSF